MLLIGGGKLITRDSAKPFIEDGAVLCDGRLIKEVGKTSDLKAKYKDAEFIDAKGSIIMPAFINIHEHIYSAMARGFSINGYNPKGFLEILDGMWLLKMVLLQYLTIMLVSVILKAHYLL